MGEKTDINTDTSVSTDYYLSRRKKLTASLNMHANSALLISDKINMQYLTGFHCTFGYLICLPDKWILITDGRYSAAARAGISGVDVIESGSDKAGDLITNILTRRKIRNLYFESSSMKVKEFESLKKCSKGFKWLDWEPPLESIRIVKDETEARAIKMACEAADSAFKATLEFIKPGVTEKEIRSCLEMEMLRLGIDRPAFDTIVASGPNGAFAHATPSGRKIIQGDFIVLDFGACLNGYNSDITRTVFIGKPSREDRRRYNAVLDAQKRAFDFVADGVKCSYADNAARIYLKEKGLEQFFIHGLGHGIGLEVHESPRLSAPSEDILKTGMVFTIEPGIYIEGWGGIRIEDTVFLTESGAVRLTKSKRTLISI